MAAPRASWKGFLKIAEVTCPIGLYAAVSSSERIVLHTVNRSTGNRVSRQYVDVGTGEPVESEDQVKGYEVGKDEYVVLEPEEIAAAVPESDKRLTVSAFVDRRRDRRRLFRPPLFPCALRPERRRGVRPDPRGAARLERRGDRPGGAVPARANASDPAAWRRSRRNVAQFRLRGPFGAGGVRRRSGARDQGRDAGARRAHHQDESRRIRSVPRAGPLRGGSGRTGQGQDRGPQHRGAEAAEARGPDRPHGRLAQERRIERQDRRRPRRRPRRKAG